MVELINKSALTIVLADYDGFDTIRWLGETCKVAPIFLSCEGYRYEEPKDHSWVSVSNFYPGVWVEIKTGNSKRDLDSLKEGARAFSNKEICRIDYRSCSKFQ